jgi:hypothetical protein
MLPVLPLALGLFEDDVLAVTVAVPARTVREYLSYRYLEKST